MDNVKTRADSRLGKFRNSQLPAKQAEKIRDLEQQLRAEKQRTTLLEGAVGHLGETNRNIGEQTHNYLPRDLTSKLKEPPLITNDNFLDEADPHPVKFPPFEWHYDSLSSDSLVRRLENIRQDLASHTQIHDWDAKFSPDPMKLVALFAIHELERWGVESGSHISSCCAVDETVTRNGVNHRLSSDPDSTRPKAYRFSQAIQEVPPLNFSDDAGRATSSPVLGYGRVVYTKESAQRAIRAALLISYAFSLRLQDEDFTFLTKFVQRHLDLKTAYKDFQLLQDASPSWHSSKYYKRVTISFHLPHLSLQLESDEESTRETFDSKCLGLFAPSRKASNGYDLPRLYNSCTSVLLTLVYPEQIASREAASNLLSVPEALWTVLLINAPQRIVEEFRTEPEQFMTPVAQFLRGICGAVISQRVNLIPLVEGLRERLSQTRILLVNDENSFNAHADLGDLFDDKSFNKSRLYHWIIKTCYDICASVASTLKFLEKLLTSQLKDLVDKAHAYEDDGMAFWWSRLTDEVSELDLIQVEVNGLKEQVLELRDALHGATAILESRAAVAQGEKIQVLTYLAVAYLPIGTVSVALISNPFVMRVPKLTVNQSLYSMNVLPSRATLSSFFVVLAVVVTITFFLSLPLVSLRIIALLSPRSTFNFRLSPRQRWRQIREALIEEYEFRTGQIADLPVARKATRRQRRAQLCMGHIWRLLYYVTDQSLNAILYGKSLFVKPPKGIYKHEFQLGKFFGDILLLLLMPVWISLLILATVIWMLVYLCKALLFLVTCSFW